MLLLLIADEARHRQDIEYGGEKRVSVDQGEEPADTKRSRFLIALQKTIEGPKPGEDGAPVTPQSLHQMLGKAAAANVSAIIVMQHVADFV